MNQEEKIDNANNSNSRYQKFKRWLRSIRDKYNSSSDVNFDKNLTFGFYERFLLQYFPNEIKHINDKDKEELMAFSDWIFHHFEDANDYLNPRTIIRYLNLLAEKQYDVYREHIENFPQTIQSKFIDSKFTCNIFQSDTIQCVFKDLQIEELKNINKLLNTKNEQDVFSCINRLYSTRRRFSSKDINLKNYQMTPEDYDRLLKYLELLGYLKPVDGKAFCIKPLYNKQLCTFGPV